MGCNIHFSVEQLKDGKWVSVASNPDYPDEKDYYHHWYQSRNYYLFSILAGVQGDFDPIVDPRGLPQDCSEELKNSFEEGDFHTPSHYTLAELLEAKKNLLSEEALLTPEGFRQHLKSPLTYADLCKSKYLASPKSQRVSNEKMQRIMKLENLMDEDFSTLVDVSFPVSDIYSKDFYTTLDGMAKLDPDPNKVRGVFWFSN